MFLFNISKLRKILTELYAYIFYVQSVNYFLKRIMQFLNVRKYICYKCIDAIINSGSFLFGGRS